MPVITRSHKTDTPLLPIGMISHGTLTSLELEASRRFYEEVLGFDVVQTSPFSLIVRKGTDHTYVVVETGQPSSMNMFDHNGLDVADRETVRTAHARLSEVKDAYGIGTITEPIEQHGAYSFYFEDGDGNWWEILEGRPRGYMLAFTDPARDITGRDDVDSEVLEHTGDDQYAQTLRDDTKA